MTRYLTNVSIENVYMQYLHVPISLETGKGASIEGVRIESGVIGIRLSDFGSTTISDCDISAAVTGQEAGILIQGLNGGSADALSQHVAIDGVIVNTWNP